MADMQPVLPPEQLPVPIRMSGIGNAHIAITASPEAQAWFDQGLNLMHDFWDYESVKAFEQSVRVDPNCAMCWWGLAQAEGFRHSPRQFMASRRWRRRFSSRTMSPSRRSSTLRRRRPTQLSRRTKHGANKQQIAILRELVTKAPRILRRGFFLLLLWKTVTTTTANRRKASRKPSPCWRAFCRTLPNDSAANHYWIHAIEPGNHPERAIQSAALLASLAPTSGHMVHMPGHIYYRVGNYAEAEHWFSASMAADETLHAGTARRSRR